MLPWFAVPPPRAIELRAVLPATLRATLLPDTWAYPRYTRLAMGCSHAVHLIMNVNLTVAGGVFLAGARLGDAACELADLESDGGKKHREQNKYETENDRLFQPDREWHHRRRVERGRHASSSNPVDDLIQSCHDARCLPYSLVQWTLQRR